jgi:hypothetical protein
MDLAATYCATRRDLEERGWFLTTRLADLTSRLMRLIGQDPQSFLDMRGECRATRREILSSHEDLREHRRKHGC